MAMLAMALVADAAAPPALVGVDVVEHLGETIPLDLPFTDAAGRPTTLRDSFKGQPVILTLNYFGCPMLCSLLLNGLVESLRRSRLELGADYRAVTVSFDPKETPAQAAEAQRGYLQSLGAPQNGDWQFLTGRAPEIRRLAEAVGFKYGYDISVHQYAHAAVVFFLAPDGKLTRYLYGVRFSPTDVRLALTEASSGRVGTTFDRALLQCYRFDPASRRYRFFVSGFLRAGGLLVFGALAVLLAMLWRRERRLAATQ